MDELLFARAQMGFSLIFHIVFSVLGMALPVLIVGVEWKSLRDPKGPWLAMRDIHRFQPHMWRIYARFTRRFRVF